jgi:hypothetical protein
VIDQVRRWTIGFAPKKRFAQSKQSMRHWKPLFQRAIRPRIERDPRVDPQAGTWFVGMVKFGPVWKRRRVDRKFHAVGTAG